MKEHKGFPKNELLKLMGKMGLQLTRNFQTQMWEVVNKSVVGGEVKIFKSKMEVNAYIHSLLEPVKKEGALENKPTGEGLHQEEAPVQELA